MSAVNIGEMIAAMATMAEIVIVESICGVVVAVCAVSKANISIIPFSCIKKIITD